MRVCRICGIENNNPCYKVREMMFGFRDEFLYFQCKNCECLQLAENPGDISKYYPGDYYSLKKYEGDKFKGIKGRIRRLTLPSNVFYKTFLDKLTSKIFPASQFKIFHEIEVTRNTRILDVGCGNGHKFLHPLAEIGFDALMGCDPFIKQSLSYPNGLRILKTDIFGMEGKWDLITYHHSFEHLERPIASLKKTKELLSPNGICIIRIPTVSSYAWDHYKANWFQIDAPRHYFIPSNKTMKYLAEQAGLKLFKIVSDSTYKQFSESEKYSNNISLRHPRSKGFLHFIKRKMKKVKYKKRTKRLNKKGIGDQAAFFFINVK